MAVTWLRANSDIVGNTASLIGSAAVTSGLGFVFWLVAARLFSPEHIGLSSAAISAMLMLSTLGVLGLDALVISEVGGRLGAADRSGAMRFVSATIVASFVTSGALGLAFAFIAPLFAANFETYFATVSTRIIFAVGVGLTGSMYVFDRAAIGFLRGALQLTRNIWFAALKLVLLPTLLLSPWLVANAGSAIYGLWAAMTAASLLAVLPAALRGSRTPDLAPAWRRLGALLPAAFRHQMLNLAQHGPTLMMPVLVVWLFSPTISAAFYIAWMLITFAQSVPANLTTTLFAVGARDPGLLADKLRVSLRLAIIAAAGIVLGTLVLGGPVLSLFGATYASIGSQPLIVLSVTVLPLTLKTHYFALARLGGFTGRAALLGGVAGIIELLAATLGARTGSLTTMSWYLLAAMLLVSLVFLPAVVRAAWRPAPSARGREESPPGQ